MNFNILNPNHIIEIFEKVLKSQKRQIFVSMKFGNKNCERHYDHIEEIVTNLNKKYFTGLKVKPLRIDRYKTGKTYKIPDKILEKIRECGLLIADLTYNNINVYHEVGYLMGICEEQKLIEPKLILILNTTYTPLKEIGFNIKSHKIILFEDTRDLEPELSAALEKFYFQGEVPPKDF